MSDDDFIGLVHARWPALFRLAYLLTGSPTLAEDMLQTAFERTYAAWPRVRRMEAPDAYVRRVLVNAIVSERRTLRRRHEVVTDAVPEAPQPDEQERLVSRDLLWPLVCALPARQRAVVVLRYYEDLTELQISEVLGCSPGTVKSQAHDAMRSLRRAVDASEAGTVTES
jgi:RNA polymerase sigma-70 factor (sigma-E family)